MSGKVIAALEAPDRRAGEPDALADYWKPQQLHATRESSWRVPERGAAFGRWNWSVMAEWPYDSPTAARISR